MKLLQEISIDDKFSAQLGKIQDAVQQLEKLTTKFGPINRPVGTQINAIELAAEDLQRLALELRKIKEA